MHLEPSTMIAIDATAYWFAGILTVAASVIVIIVMLAISRIEDDESS